MPGGPSPARGEPLDAPGVAGFVELGFLDPRRTRASRHDLNVVFEKKTTGVVGANPAEVDALLVQQAAESLGAGVLMFNPKARVSISHLMTLGTRINPIERITRKSLPTPKNPAPWRVSYLMNLAVVMLGVA